MSKSVNMTTSNINSRLYDLVARGPNFIVGNEPRLQLYRQPDYPKIKSKNIKLLRKDSQTRSIRGMIDVKDDPRVKRTTNGRVQIAFTAMGDRGPVVLFLHGVPTSRYQYHSMMNRLKPFCRCIAIDMLGMGESQLNRSTVRRLNPGPNWQRKVWLWKYDTTYIHNLMTELYGDEKFVFYADDWGGGVLFHYASRYPDDLLNQVYQDPVALDGYPVNEIQAIGRASNLPDDKFKMIMASFDQTAIQIYKTMVYQPSKVWNQYSYRLIMYPYVDIDYVNGSSQTMNLKMNNLRNLADRSSVLSARQLLPYHTTKNTGGVKYDQMKAKALFLWGSEDNMMPEAQRHRLRYIIQTATEGKVSVKTEQIPKAGHFANLDRPDYVAASLLDYLMACHGVDKFGDVFFGFKETRLWKGDERDVIAGFRSLVL